jgi:outer membrane protein, multidrug efflux system
MKATVSTLALLLASSLTWAAPPDGGIATLQAGVAGKIVGIEGAAAELPRPAIDARSTIAALLSAPLTGDAAVRIALLNNPALQAALGREGLSITDAVAGNTPAKLRAEQAVTVLSAQAFKAWVNAVAADRSAQILRDAKATAEASGELMRRMVQTGNMSKLTQAQSQLALSEAALALVRAEQAASAAREQLTVVLGLWGADTLFTLPSKLPALPAQAMELPDIEARALQARTDFQAATAQWQCRRPVGRPGRRRTCAQASSATAQPGAQRLCQLPQPMGHRKPPGKRGATASPVHSRRDGAALQRHADQRV